MRPIRPERRRPRGLLWPIVAALPVFCILVGLGIWQIDRKQWKEGLLRAVAERSRGEPAAVPPPSAWGAFDPAADEFRRVRLAGTFRHDREVQVHGLAEERRGLPLQGFYVFTPLDLDGGGTVLVNRGFVPTPLRDPAARPDGMGALIFVPMT